MTSVRSTVLPCLRVLAWLAIAVALCVLAFGRGAARPKDDALTPTGALSDPVVAVGQGDLVSTLSLTGTVAADPASGQKATAAGTVSRLRVKAGDPVAVGTPLLDVVQTVDPVAAPVGATDVPPVAPRTRTVTVASTAAGTVGSLAVLAQQEVTVGADIAVVTPGTLSVSAPLTQAQQFRLLTPPGSAQAQAQGGPAPFSCGGVTTGAPSTDASSSGTTFDPYTGQPAAPPTAQVSCHVPPGTTVFAGMSVDLTLELGRVDGVVTVPLTAVLGSVGTGKVWVVDGAGGPAVEHDVTLGLTDGTSVQITGGLTVGQQILQYAHVDPNAPAAAPSPGGSGG